MTALSFTIAPSVPVAFIGLSILAVSVESSFKNKKALLIGINYLNTPYELSGCIADIERMKTFLESKGFNDFDMMTDLTDIKPTRINILNKVVNFINNSVDGDLLFIHFSGHGSYTYDANNDEIDENDENETQIEADSRATSPTQSNDEINSRR